MKNYIVKPLICLSTKEDLKYLRSNKKEIVNKKGQEQYDTIPKRLTKLLGNKNG